jgi:hypothetical protein
MIDRDRPTDPLYVAALGADVVNYGGINRDGMFAAIEALKLADPSESERWAAFVPERGVRKSFDSSDVAIVERAESKLRDLGARYLSDQDAQREFHSIVSALRGLELVEEQQLGRWYSELIIRNDPEPEVSSRSTRLHALSGLRLGPFVRLVPPPSGRRRGFRINTIELFEEAIAIRWHHIKPEPDYDGTLSWPRDESEELPAEIEFDAGLTDDLGTEYDPATGGSSWSRWDDGSIVGHGIDVRSPAPPPDASLLTYSPAGFDIEIPIGQDG